MQHYILSTVSGWRNLLWLILETNKFLQSCEKNNLLFYGNKYLSLICQHASSFHSWAWSMYLCILLSQETTCKLQTYKYWHIPHFHQLQDFVTPNITAAWLKCLRSNAHSETSQCAACSSRGSGARTPSLPCNLQPRQRWLCLCLKWMQPDRRTGQEYSKPNRPS